MPKCTSVILCVCVGARALMCALLCLSLHIIASQYVTASGVTLLIRQNTEQGDTYDEIALKEYSMDALKAVISGTSEHINMVDGHTTILLIPSQ